jgi:hypothetical protein
VTKAISARHGMAAELVPADIRAKIPQAELLDRLEAARELVAKSQTASDATLRRGYSQLARAILGAQPRAVTERQHRELLAKAAGTSPALAETIRRQAAELLERHPVAPRRADSERVAKAAAETPGGYVAVYDAAGQLVGLVDPAKIQPVSQPKPPGDDTSGQDPASSAVAKARRPQRRPAPRRR